MSEQSGATPSDPTGLPLVTAIVPTKDRPELMKRAVQRIVDQDYAGPIEILVVFDAPEAGEVDVETPANRTIRTLTNERKPGLAGNRNTGITHAQGAYLGHCDDDDEWLPSKVTNQVAILQSRPDASMLTSGMLVCYQGIDTPRPGSGTDLHLEDFLLSRRAEVHSSTFFFERSMLDRIGFVDEDLPGGYAEDYEFLLRASRVGPVICQAEPQARIHFHDGSFFASKWPMIDEALQHLLDQYPEFDTVPAGKARIEGQLALANAAMGQKRTAVRYASRSLRRKPTAMHSYAALAVASGLVSPEKVADMAKRRGKGL